MLINLRADNAKRPFKNNTQVPIPAISPYDFKGCVENASKPCPVQVLKPRGLKHCSVYLKAHSMSF